jgi:hypothetical protein
VASLIKILAFFASDLNLCKRCDIIHCDILDFCVCIGKETTIGGGS